MIYTTIIVPLGAFVVKPGLWNKSVETKVRISKIEFLEKYTE